MTEGTALADGQPPAGEPAEGVLAERFTEAMSRLVSGVAVATARRADGRPTGMLVSSLCSYSVRPPSVLMAVADGSRTGRELSAGPGTAFGLHLLGADGETLARVFAGGADDKFADVLWEWDGEVPRLLGADGYLRCRVAAAFPHGDHTALVGEVSSCVPGEGQPLVYYRRRLDWRLR
ncbi:flavin reductase family protein [Streptomyces sp. CC208A]|uniref:flavin reductase family protein n=1 Tax=Streptomyces sp. CC208A TaxID=3044573 RepID=UPI0024A7E05B|nr:flavin reductase family protein [Streptomyces sp. CC208A]